MYTPPDTDMEQEARVRAALVTADRNLADRLLSATKPGTWERAFLLTDPATFDAAARMTLKRIAWFYRTRLPHYLRPTKNPDDPIVREREFLNGR